MVHFNPDRWRCKNWYFLTYTHTYWLYPCPSCLLHDLEYVTPVDGAIFLSKGIWKSGFECKTVSLELMTSDASEAKMKFWPMKYISRRFIKHEYLRSRAYICLSLSSPSGDLSIKSWTIEILVRTSWILHPGILIQRLPKYSSKHYIPMCIIWKTTSEALEENKLYVGSY